jgi:hypothetical protein
MLVSCSSVVSAQPKQAATTNDTIYIFLDRSHTRISSQRAVIELDGEERFIGGYILEKDGVDDESLELRFVHRPIQKSGVETGVGTDVRIYEKDSSFLSTISPLTYEWFEQHNAGYIDAYFGRYNSNQPLIFIIDKADIKEGKLLLIQVVYHGSPDKE